MRERPPKVRQRHGGALYAGGVPGNRGGGRARSVATQRAGEALDDVVRRIGQVIERRPDTCPHCGGAVEVMPELTLAEHLRILTTLAEVVWRARSPTLAKSLVEELRKRGHNIRLMVIGHTHWARIAHPSGRRTAGDRRHLGNKPVSRGSAE